MTRSNTLVAILLIPAALIACAGGDPAPTDSTTGGGGSVSTSSSSSSSGSGREDDDAGAGGSSTGGQGGAGGVTTPFETAVGAAYAKPGDARVVLIDVTGTRSAVFNPSTGVFESADDLDELEGGPPIADVIAAGLVGEETYLIASDGQVTVYDHGQASFTTPEPLAEVLEDAPFPSVGAAFGYGEQLFVFNVGGTSYAAYRPSQDSWSPIYSFATDFGGGGAPIANVGAAYVDDGGAIVLFDKSGTKFCMYASGGTFSSDFDISELGDGNLTFEDTDED